MKNDQLVIPIEKVQQAIYLVRGQKVMLDKDLARLYGVETRVLNQAVRRNAERFPGDFVFKLTRDEIIRISQFVISSDLKFSKNVYAFTQEGVAMLSGVLRSERAVQVNIAIMRAFVRLREALSTHKDLARKLVELEKRITGHDESIRLLFQAIRELMNEPVIPRKQIGFHLKERPSPYMVRPKRKEGSRWQ
ncbi:MAG: ORF6N domain-containing protein [Thermodesulfobacteriota bacterium]|jgi:phage regulator Rha-like protein